MTDLHPDNLILQNVYTVKFRALASDAEYIITGIYKGMKVGPANGNSASCLRSTLNVLFRVPSEDCTRSLSWGRITSIEEVKSNTSRRRKGE